MACEFFRSSRSSDSRKAIHQFSFLLAACERNISFPRCTSLSQFLWDVGLVFWTREAYHIFPFSTFMVGASRALSILLPRSEICKNGLYLRECCFPGEQGTMGKILIKNLICVTSGDAEIFYLFFSFFFYLIFFSSLRDFYAVYTPSSETRGSNSGASAYLWLSIRIPPDICLSVIASTVNRGIRFAMFRKAVV